jgi:hypothetical protein
MAGTGFGLVIVVIGLGGLMTPGDLVAGVVFLIVGCAFTSRAVVTPDVTVDDGGVRTRSMLRTRRYPFSAIRSVEVARGTTGLNGSGRQYLRFALADGTTVNFKEFNASSKAGSSSNVYEAAAAIQARLGRGAG